MKNKGFTLVELAILMVIIGLLIGGILKGQEMIRTAKVNSTISAVKSASAALGIFEDKYSARPGDLLSATQRLPGCTGNCVSGNGDRIIGQLLTESTWGSLVQAGNATLPRVETTMFWRHLALAEIITGVDTVAPVSPPEGGITHPNVAVGGVFEITSAEFGITQNSGGGFILRLLSSPGRLSDGIFLDPSIARMIDTKMDDGNPFRGTVTADFEGSGCGLVSIRDYSSGGDGSCVMYFKLDTSY